MNVIKDYVCVCRWSSYSCSDAGIYSHLRNHSLYYRRPASADTRSCRANCDYVHIHVQLCQRKTWTGTQLVLGLVWMVKSLLVSLLNVLKYQRGFKLVNYVQGLCLDFVDSVCAGYMWSLFNNQQIHKSSWRVVWTSYSYALHARSHQSNKILHIFRY